MVKKTQKAAPKKPAHNNSVHHEPVEDNHLYVSIDNVAEKRKNVLLSLRESLLVQQEYEQLIEIRDHKQKVLSHIKVEMNHINSKYQRLKSHFPNVKDSINNVEMELDKIRSNIDQLNKGGFEVVPKEEHTATVKTESKETKTEVPVEKKPVSRIGRIENNLKLIEDKLKGL